VVSVNVMTAENDDVAASQLASHATTGVPVSGRIKTAMPDIDQHRGVNTKVSYLEAAIRAAATPHRRQSLVTA